MALNFPMLVHGKNPIPAITDFLQLPEGKDACATQAHRLQLHFWPQNLRTLQSGTRDIYVVQCPEF